MGKISGAGGVAQNTCNVTEEMRFQMGFPMRNGSSFPNAKGYWGVGKVITRCPAWAIFFVVCFSLVCHVQLCLPSTLTLLQCSIRHTMVLHSNWNTAHLGY